MKTDAIIRQSMLLPEFKITRSTYYKNWSWFYSIIAIFELTYYLIKKLNTFRATYADENNRLISRKACSKSNWFKTHAELTLNGTLLGLHLSQINFFHPHFQIRDVLRMIICLPLQNIWTRSELVQFDRSGAITFLCETNVQR